LQKELSVEEPLLACGTVLGVVSSPKEEENSAIPTSRGKVEKKREQKKLLM